MTITKYDYDLGRLVYPGATLPSPCPHGWTERCPHCMGGEINRLRAELPQEPQQAQTLAGMIAAIYGYLDAEDCARIDREWARQRGFILPTDGTSALTRPDRGTV